MSIETDARQEAERRWPALNPGDVELTYPRGALRATARKAFEAGAVWAREKGTQEPSDAEVEAAGRGLYENRVSLIEGEAERRSWPTWEGLEKTDADEWRDAGLAALLAAREVRNRG